MDVLQVLEGCIAASVTAEFERMVRQLASASVGVPRDADRILAISRGCSEILDEEVAYFSPLFSSHVQRPAELAASRVHDCFNAYLLPWLQTGAALAPMRQPLPPHLQPPPPARLCCLQPC